MNRFIILIISVTLGSMIFIAVELDAIRSGIKSIAIELNEFNRRLND